MPAAHWRAVSECKMNYGTDRTRMKGAQLESLLEMLPGLPKLDDISEPVLDEAERVLKKWGEDSPSWRNAVRRFLSAPPAAATNVVAVACQSVVVGLFLHLNE